MSNWRDYLGYGPANLVTESNVKTKYKRLALRLHPNKNPGNPRATQNFQKMQKMINAALLYAQTANQRAPPNRPPPRQRTPPNQPPPRQRTPPNRRQPQLARNYAVLISHKVPTTFYMMRHAARKNSVFRISTKFDNQVPYVQTEVYDDKLMQYTPVTKWTVEWGLCIMARTPRAFSFSLKFNPVNSSVAQWIPIPGLYNESHRSFAELARALQPIARQQGINMEPYINKAHGFLF
jgi:hypothetical protein